MIYDIILASIISLVLIGAGIITLRESFSKRCETNLYKPTINEKILGLFITFIFFSIAIAIIFIIIKIN